MHVCAAMRTANCRLIQRIQYAHVVMHAAVAGIASSIGIVRKICLNMYAISYRKEGSPAVARTYSARCISPRRIIGVCPHVRITRSFSYRNYFLNVGNVMPLRKQNILRKFYGYSIATIV